MIVSKIERHHNGRQLHNRHVHVWRWEYNMYKFIGVDWQDTAQDRDVYRDKVFFRKISGHKGGRYVRVVGFLRVLPFRLGPTTIWFFIGMHKG
jgi:hypothetical protein